MDNTYKGIVSSSYYRMPIRPGKKSMPSSAVHKQKKEIIEKMKKHLPFRTILQPAMVRSNIYNLIFEDSIRRFHTFSSEELQICEQFKETVSRAFIDMLETEESVSPETAKLNQPKKKQYNLTLVKSAASKYNIVDDASCELEAIQLILERIHNQSSSKTAKDSEVSILDITNASVSDLHSLLRLFKADVPDTATEKDMTGDLLKFIPVALVQAFFQEAVSTGVCAGCSIVNSCSWCSKQCCEHSPLKVCCYPRTGLATSTLCTECISYNMQQDANDWGKASLNFLAEPNDQSIIASLGCALIAMALGFDSQNLLKSIARLLQSHGMHAVAYCIINLAISLSQKGSKEEGKMHFSAASMLNDMTEAPNMTLDEKYIITSAAKEAFDMACKALENNTEIPESEKKREKIENLKLQVFVKKAQQFQELWKEAVTKGSLPDLLVVLREIDSGFFEFLESQASFSKTSSLQPFTKFTKGLLKLNEGNFDSALIDFESMAWNVSILEDPASTPKNDASQEASDENTEISESKKKEELLPKKKEDKYVEQLESFWKNGDITWLGETDTEFLQFLESTMPHSIPPKLRLCFSFTKEFLKLREKKQLDSALVHIVSVASNASGFLQYLLLAVYMYMSTKHFNSVYSFDALKHYLRSDSKKLAFFTPILASLEERSIKLFFPSDKELTPPFENNWPFQAHQEHVVMSFFNTNQWSIMQVASFYIDFAPKMNNPAEKSICYLLATMWMTKNFDSESKLDADVLFAYKTIVIKLLLLSCETIMDRVCNPGIELYIIRLAIGIIRKIALMPCSELVFTYEDAFFLQKLLQRLLQVSHMFPFWNPPSISLSEAVLFTKFTSKLHSEFLYELQFIEPEHKPLKSHDFTYQIHYNDLVGILPLENSSDSRARAMNELLKSQGLSWNDIVQTMSTQLCPRDEEGWIIQSPDLGVSMEYAEVVGFIFDANADEPFVKLLVVKANPKLERKGLFSQEDINTLLQLDPDDLLFFSLDPPSGGLDKCYHSFQQWRYSTEKIKGTEVLNTMFITDYLMKSFCTNCDISSKPPFKQRPCEDGLTKALPPKLKHALRSIEERCRKTLLSRNRFWIESKKINYKIKQNGLQYEYHFGEAAMEVKSQSLPFGIDGALNLHPDSSHASFAMDMTENYSELSEHFPVFARLQQLAKLHFFSLELQLLIQRLKEEYPEKSASLTHFIEIYKQPQPQESSTRKCEWVPAVSSSKSRSFHYGGVQLWNGTADFITGCYGNTNLQKLCKSPAELLDSCVLETLRYVMVQKSGDVIDCNDKVYGIYIVKDEISGRMIVGKSNNAFQFVEKIITEVGNVVYSVIPLRTELNVQSTMTTFLEKIREIHENIKICGLKDFAPKLHSLACGMDSRLSLSCDDVSGVNLSVSGENCQADDIPFEYENVIAVPVHQIMPATFALMPHINYSPPIGNAQRQNFKSFRRFNSWNKTNESSSFSDSDPNPVELQDSAELEEIAAISSVNGIQLMQDILSAKQPLTLSTFRRQNSTELNKQLDKLYHSVFTGFSLQQIPE